MWHFQQSSIVLYQIDPLEAPSLLQEVNDLAQSLIDLQRAEVQKDVRVLGRHRYTAFGLSFFWGFKLQVFPTFSTKLGHIFWGRCGWWSAGRTRAWIFLQQRSQCIQSDEAGSWTHHPSDPRPCSGAAEQDQRNYVETWNRKSCLTALYSFFTYFTYTYRCYCSQNHTTPTTTTATTATTRTTTRTTAPTAATPATTTKTTNSVIVV